jgi:hypothetical protein
MNASEFWSRVLQTDKHCWLWQGSSAGSRRNNRYGNLLFEGKIQKAHRVAWQIIWGAIPVGAYVLHHCDTPLCVRPDHLFLGSLSDNSLDCYAKGRSSLPNARQIRVVRQKAQELCKRGHLLSGRNLYLRPDRHGRVCKTCRRATWRKWRRAQS